MVNCNVLGLGYIGLPTAAILSSVGHKVNGVDINKKIIKDLIKGQIHINEPKLSEMIKAAMQNELLSLNSNPIEADIHFIAVPTPIIKSTKGNPKPDISYVLNAAKSIAKIIKKNDLVIIESTCPVGTTNKVSKVISDYGNISIKEFHIAYCPERVLPGNIIDEIKNNNRVIGGNSEEANKEAIRFFSTFCNGDLVKTDSKTAELIKLSENAFRDLNIAFANELSMICDHYQIDEIDLIRIANQHPRVNILNPGIGVGGHCIAVDPWFIISELSDKSELIKKARETNLKKTKWVLSKIESIISNFEIKNKFKNNFTYGFLGITFKPNVDDTRGSPSLWIISQLLSKKINMLVSDPYALNQNVNIELSPLREVLNKSDLTFILVGHKEYSSLGSMNKKIIDICQVMKNA